MSRSRGSRQQIAKRYGKKAAKGTLNTLKKPVVFLPLAGIIGVGAYAAWWSKNGRPSVPTLRFESLRWFKNTSNPNAIDVHFRVKNVATVPGRFTVGTLFADTEVDDVVAGYQVENMAADELRIIIIENALPYTATSWRGFAGTGDYGLNASLERVSYFDFTVDPPNTGGSGTKV